MNDAGIAGKEACARKTSTSSRRLLRLVCEDYYVMLSGHKLDVYNLQFCQHCLIMVLTLAFLMRCGLSKVYS